MTKQAGFSLVEILIAISIMVLLGTIVGIALNDLPTKGRYDAAKLQVDAFKTAIQLYIADNGMPPTQRQGLAALVTKPTDAPIPQKYKPNGYLDSREVPLDPWGNDYAYLVPGSNGEPFEVICYGADGEVGGEGYDADISSTK